MPDARIIQDETTSAGRPHERRYPAVLLLVFFLLLLISGPVVIAGFVWGGRMIGSLVTVGLSLVYVVIYMIVVRRYG